MLEAKTHSSGPIPRNGVVDIFRDVFSVYEGDGNENFERLELAAAQLAICLSVHPNPDTVPTVPDIRQRIGEVMTDDVQDFDAKDLLTETEKPFFDAARTIVGLVYGGARMNTETIKPVLSVTRRSGRRSAIL